MAVEHKSVPTLGGSIKKTRARETAAPMSGEAVVSEVMRAYRTIDALTAENALLRERLETMGKRLAEKAADKENGGK